MRGEDGHFILWRICGKSPDGANADEPHLAAGWLGVVWLREREDGLKKAAAAWEGIPSGQATTSVAWWIDD